MRFTFPSLFIFAVVPHITDAIQEWVERVANQPVTEDGTKPQVCEDGKL
jgi:CTP synthase (UTP-ammonia lyase)